MEINLGDCSFILICSALVLLMTPGLAFFYGGMVRRKNVLNTLMSSFFVCGLASIMWVLVGYSLSFGNDFHGIIGGLNFLGFNGVGADPSAYAPTIPQELFAAYQMMFAVITPALITGSLIGRMKFSALFIFVAVWSLFVYYPMAHMVWGAGGVIGSLGAVDFAGGNVVHISSGISGLVACIMLGKRRGHGMMSYRPHNIPFVVLGAALLWFGWFGFNAGSALNAGPLAVHAFMTTNTAAAAAMLSWMFIEKVKHGKPTVLGAATGAVVGLVAITPGAGFVPLWSSIVMGIVVSPICFFFVEKVKAKFGYDDALDAFGCHGVGGIWGGIATGIFGQTAINPVAQWNGLFYGDIKLFIAQIMSIVITIIFAGGMTFLIIKVMKMFMDIRVDSSEEADGLDIAEHGESAYPAFTGLD
ncbi:ammonium transporter [Clostridium saccharobutylicum]|uniref:Ammonium transporter n=1 Tax=Clostridium saccharobutylicum DSM 13864 TaxID=1345695 RepID=U5MTB8_CLOSA|nr:ammonium transporter [Clostridium saccharobutylicum]AGX42871.1 ammonium transporter NrgA [Clostridium saccharobutylicum DSM 13864]AQR90166.1 ammonium transporter NrgA [Clostridium saccharobutylicum]AQS00072.1 ammonium transporter NrgA [Clostridium saccharobutylicum]AQS09860.1 ammonium transporter NrgA [Clostridium saccharobutylicum]AQS14055.1 ammonium transporter NrgA [Clostridium saccharobutylicum]